MAGISTILAQRDEGGGALRIGRAAPDRRRVALAVLLTGRPREDDPAVEQFIRFAGDQKLSLDELWLASDGPRAVAAALLVTSPGRTGMLFSSPVAGRSAVGPHSRLLHAVCAAQDSSDLAMVQSLLEGHQRLERQTLEVCGFEALAVLVYMQRSAQPAAGSRAAQAPPSLNLGDPSIRGVHYSEAQRPLFTRAVEASYEQTLDCPRLLGVRAMGDVLDGHMATGEFDPRLWHVFLEGDQPIGVMLLAKVPAKQAVELVYLGVSLPWRGRGLARRMMAVGLDAAARCGALNVLLAVDEQNAPALRLYRSLGFRPTGRRTAMVLHLGRG